MAEQTRVRWRRRNVPKVRVTWNFMVIMLLMMIDEELMTTLPLRMGGKFLLTLGIVLLPSLALILWRLGLLPPERVEEPLP